MDRNGTWKHTDSRTMSHREVRPTDLRPKKQRLHVTRPRTNHMAQSFHNKAKGRTSNMDGGAHYGETVAQCDLGHREENPEGSHNNTYTHNSLPEERGRVKRQTKIKQVLDPNTRDLAKKYFKLIQAIHHKNITDRAISTGTPPAGMMRQVRKLSGFIKPASPTEEVKNKITINTNKWMEENLIVLRDHYANIISQYSLINRNNVALQVAANWAEKRYRGRLAPTTATTVERVLAAAATAVQNPDPHYTPPSVLLSNQPLLSNRDSEEEPPTVSKPLDVKSREQFPPLPRPSRNLQTLCLGNRPTLQQQVMAAPQTQIQNQPQAESATTSTDTRSNQTHYVLQQTSKLTRRNFKSHNSSALKTLSPLKVLESAPCSRLPPRHHRPPPLAASSPSPVTNLSPQGPDQDQFSISQLTLHFSLDSPPAPSVINDPSFTEQTPYHPIKSSVCDPGGEIYQPQATNRKQGLQVTQPCHPPPCQGASRPDTLIGPG
ncbi:uncharacterized protein LOC121202123 [Betta splendens]|uniref:Uncharacterized protein LOC121202123 n=1 Tax=Betta splendens TaxID=158456 RepID=A0A8M1HC11_BETSP|nr:uncharacterized protein LOC121202123 [Betta splendens]